MVAARHTFLFIVHLLILLLIGCSKGEQEQSEDTPLARQLLEARTVIEASSAIREAEFASCQERRRALLALDARPEEKHFDPRSYRGLIEEILDASRLACAIKNDQSQQKLQGVVAEQRGSTALAIARSLIEATPAEGLRALEGAKPSAALLRRRAELLFALERHREARQALVDSLPFDDDVETRARAARLANLAGDAELALKLCAGRSEVLLRKERIGALALRARYSELVAEIHEVPLHLRGEASEYALARAANAMELLAEKNAPSDLLEAGVSKLGSELEDGGAALLQRAAQLSPERAELHMALAEALEASGRAREAVASWDRAAQLAAGAERPVLAPIRILFSLGEKRRARARASKLATRAKSAEELRLAAFACKYAGQLSRAAELARKALAQRPGDGRLRSELATRLEEAGQHNEAAELLASLLVCGARGQPWHRHEIAARLRDLVDADELRERVSKVPCEPVKREELAEYLSE